MTIWVFDSEVYKNLYMVAFMNTSKEVKSFRAPFSSEQIKEIKSILKNDTIVGFNSMNYDLPLLSLALNNASEAKIKKRSDEIIQNNLRFWQGGELPECKDHIDLIEVAFGKASLKIYGGRLNSKRMQSLPIHFDKVLTEEEKDLIEDYCINDLNVTGLLCKNLSQQLKIRQQMSKDYKINLMSKSDAQIAEAVIKSKIPNAEKRIVDPGHTFKYKPPKWLSFITPELKDIFQKICETEFVIQDSGKVKLPYFAKKTVIKKKESIEIECNEVVIAGKPYKLGIGGLHSMEKKTYRTEDSETVISDHDVASYYPSIILNEKLCPEHLSDSFLDVYKTIVDDRLKAKASGDKVTADTLKIVINGSFGKFGSKWSVLFAPEMLIQVTLTGQLALLMLIDKMEEQKIPVISANTDGIVLACPADRVGLRDKVLRWWESKTGFITEETKYKGLYSRDVNNYLAVKPDGSYKGKGIFAMPSMSKNTQYPIVYKAAANYLANGESIESTIRNCSEPSMFCAIRTVKGGALDAQGNELGTAIRWYYSTESEAPITYQLNGNKVPQTDGALPMMELLDQLPPDIDYHWYIDTAKGVLHDVGIDY